MTNFKSEIITIQNNAATVSVDLLGGAITDFHLQNGGINPLTFRFTPDNMPENNRSGAYYQGHFICTGRWGAPSPGEKEAGLPDHGQAANLPWAGTAKGKEITMQVVMPLEGLTLHRTLILDDASAVVAVTEAIKNTNPLGRLHNIVQHPSLAKPFLTAGTVVNCNAGKGFNYMLNTKPLEHAAQWPTGIMEDGGELNLSKPDKSYSSVFSFIIKKESEFGWITAYSPQHNLLLGYLWKREDFPWISLWQDFDGDNIRYRGLEFGTTGMHKPYKEIIDEGNHKVFGEDSYKYIDAGETQTHGYLAFMMQTPAGFADVSNVTIANGQITIIEATGRQTNIQTKAQL